MTWFWLVLRLNNESLSPPTGILGGHSMSRIMSGLLVLALAGQAPTATGPAKEQPATPAQGKEKGTFIFYILVFCFNQRLQVTGPAFRLLAIAIPLGRPGT
jgi:hypothetical protein